MADPLFHRNSLKPRQSRRNFKNLQNSCQMLGATCANSEYRDAHAGHLAGHERHSDVFVEGARNVRTASRSRKRANRGKLRRRNAAFRQKRTAESRICTGCLFVTHLFHLSTHGMKFPRSKFISTHTNSGIRADLSRRRVD